MIPSLPRTVDDFPLELKSKTIQGEIDEIDSTIPQLVSEIEKKLKEFSNRRVRLFPWPGCSGIVHNRRCNR